MVRAYDRLPDVEWAMIERRCLGLAALVVIESGEVVEAGGKVLVLAPELFLYYSEDIRNSQ